MRNAPSGTQVERETKVTAGPMARIPASLAITAKASWNESVIHSRQASVVWMSLLLGACRAGPYLARVLTGMAKPMARPRSTMSHAPRRTMSPEKASSCRAVSVAGSAMVPMIGKAAMKHRNPKDAAAMA